MSWIVQSGVWVSACALALTLLTARSVGFHAPWPLLAATGLGVLAVYGFDRWDSSGRPRGWGLGRMGFWVVPAVLAIAPGLMLPLPTILILAFVCALALLHARLRELPWVKPAYITLAWVLVVVGLPWSIRGGPQVPPVLGPVGLAILANVLACDAVDQEAEAVEFGPHRTWWLARALALAGVGLGLLHPDSRPATAVPAMLLLALLRWPATRSWAERGLDGALLVGALIGFSLEWI